jgi:hypothetical protein
VCVYVIVLLEFPSSQLEEEKFSLVLLEFPSSLLEEGKFTGSSATTYALQGIFISLDVIRFIFL